MPLSDAVFPGVARGRPHYESFYLKAAEPGAGRAIWLRHTVHQRPGQAPTAAVWCTVFDAAAGRPVALKERFGADAVRAGDGNLVRVGDSTIGLRSARGGLAARAAWRLELSEGEEEFPYLPASWLYRAPLPRTKAVSLRPVLRVSGELELDGRHVLLEGWPGMLGHNWGSEHAERWVWVHAAGFDGRPDAWLDMALGRVRIGGRALPWIANGCLSLEGRRHRLGGIGRTRRTRVEATPAGCSLVLPGGGMSVEARVGVPPDQMVVWRYADPEGPEHHTANCSAADLDVVVRAEGRTERLTCHRAAAYELGMREHDHGLLVEPHPDP